MLTRLTVTLKRTKGEKLNVNMSSLMHGVLMEHLDPVYGEVLHEQGLKPYAQHLELEDETVRWIVTTMTEEAGTQITARLQEALPKKITLRSKDIDLAVDSICWEDLSYEDFVETHFFGQADRFVRLRFITPTAFKSHGTYIFYPTIRHIFQSLMQKYDAVSSKDSIADPQLLNDLEEYCQIVNYRLRSTTFHLEGTKIPSFLGDITIKTDGPQQLVNLVDLLVNFGTYSGVGIKTALGMGAMDVVERRG